jgi:hypothetical protein
MYKTPRWTTQEEDELRSMYMAGATMPLMAQVLQRSEVTIRAKLSNCRGVWKIPTSIERRKMIVRNTQWRPPTKS